MSEAAQAESLHPSSLDGAATALGGKLVPRSDNGKMVILRTFCPFDIDKLADGFDSWVTFFPCGSEDAHPDRMDVDILLFFSAAWDLWPKAKTTTDVSFFLNRTATFPSSHLLSFGYFGFRIPSISIFTLAFSLNCHQDIVRKFDEGHYPWSKCFGKIYVDSAHMPPEQDLYEPPKQQINRLWVNGPNRQFEKGLRACQFPMFSTHGYQLAYLMEPDSVPLWRFWLDKLLNEIEERRPFAVLGSKYRGDKWYDFIKELEIPLLNHINGNAIYNVSHVLMNLMLGQLEVEADQMYNFIPFDLRMGQMWTEGKETEKGGLY